VAQSVGSHMLSLMGLSGLYLAWAAVGKSVTGESPFFWMDEAQVGSKEAVSLYSIGFVLLAPTSKYLPSSPTAQCRLLLFAEASRFQSVVTDMISQCTS